MTDLTWRTIPASPKHPGMTEATCTLTGRSWQVCEDSEEAREVLEKVVRQCA